MHSVLQQPQRRGIIDAARHRWPEDNSPRPPLEYRLPFYGAPDVTQQHLQQQSYYVATPHIPLPLGAPLPPAEYPYFASAANSGHQSHYYPAAEEPYEHPLYEDISTIQECLAQNLHWSEYDALSAYHRMLPQQASTCATYPSESGPGTNPTTSGISAWDVEKLGRASGESFASAGTYPNLGAHDGNRVSPLPKNPPVVPAKASSTPVDAPDPYAADFIRDHLGEHKWMIFVSRLSENRKNIRSRSSSLKKPTVADNTTNAYREEAVKGSCAIDFLVKVEVVKAVLRAYVPHPYDHSKTLSHYYALAPQGKVILSRATVLSLSGWSNTQFAYWARRAEAISALASQDERLLNIASVLERRLIEDGVVTLPQPPSPTSSNASPASSPSICASDSGPRNNVSVLTFPNVRAESETWVRNSVTGKGLDVIIDEVKKRTGVSPFLRGRHSSLDPFAHVNNNSNNDPANTQNRRLFLDNPPSPCSTCTTTSNTTRTAIQESPKPLPSISMPTFQAEKYVHDVPAPSTSKYSSMVIPENSQFSEMYEQRVKEEGSPGPTMSPIIHISPSHSRLSTSSPVAPKKRRLTTTKVSKSSGQPSTVGSFADSESPFRFNVTPFDYNTVDNARESPTGSLTTPRSLTNNTTPSPSTNEIVHYLVSNIRSEVGVNNVNKDTLPSSTVGVTRRQGNQKRKRVSANPTIDFE
ncbi:hypothetical protein C8Q75DRAFT_887404 [Abortiporus biennis]|nr:hypothetical protein C8Q75DRAFT_887404 [Abortiporus biennis]